MSVQVEGYRNESFESLEAAVMETSRGRWFLEEYARRQRSAETLAILEILKKLENSVTNNSFLPASKSAEPAQALKSEQLKFFKQDEEIFVEPAVAAPTSLSVVSNTPKAEVAQPAEPKGAKLKIQRMQPSQSPEEPVVVEPEKPAAPASAPEPVASVAPPPAAEPKQRVVIIRRPASEAAEIPLMEEKSSEAAA
jgi:hypothetical protein